MHLNWKADVYKRLTSSLLKVVNVSSTILQRKRGFPKQWFPVKFSDFKKSKELLMRYLFSCYEPKLHML